MGGYVLWSGSTAVPERLEIGQTDIKPASESSDVTMTLLVPYINVIANQPVTTTTSVTTPQASVGYGKAVTFTATVTAGIGTTAPGQGSVNFFDFTTDTDLGAGAFAGSLPGSNANSTWTLTTAAKTFDVTAGDVITATYSPGTDFAGSSNTVTQTITAMPITVTAASDVKIYDGTTIASTVPAITSGSLVAGDTVAFSRTFTGKNVGTGKLLRATGWVDDGNSGNNYAVTFATAVTGQITVRAITVTATTNEKVYDGTTSAASVPTIASGSLVSGDTAAFSETFDSKNVGISKTLTATGSVNDDNGGANTR